jgi:hypothetical protein
MKQMARKLIAGPQARMEYNFVQTTLYELIAAINEGILPEEDWIVTDTVFELFETGRARFLAPIDSDAI